MDSLGGVANIPHLGAPVDIGASAVHKRIDAMNRCWPLQGSALLDVGCGNGSYTVEMARRFAKVEAIDVVSEHLAAFREQVLPAAEARERIHIRELDAAELDYPDDTFDVVTMIEVLEHVGSVDATLRQIERVLRPGGALVVTVPNRLFPIETHALEVGERTLNPKRLPFLPWIPPLHRKLATARTYTVRSLRRSVEGATGLRLACHTHVMPPFDRWERGRRFIRPMTELLERTPARAVGVSIVAAFSAHGGSAPLRERT